MLAKPAAIPNAAGVEPITVGVDLDASGAPPPETVTRFFSEPAPPVWTGTSSSKTFTGTDRFRIRAHKSTATQRRARDLIETRDTGGSEGQTRRKGVCDRDRARVGAPPLFVTSTR